MKNPKDQARSILSRLSNLSKKEKVPYQLLLTEFLIERLAVRILLEPRLSQAVVFKGGYVSLRVHHSPRYTVDLDALLKSGTLEKIRKPVCEAAEKDIDDAVWFRFESSLDLKTQGEYGGLRLTFRSGIGEVLQNLKRAQIINLDIGKGDPIVPGPVLVETPYLLGGGSLTWYVYPVETTVAEKLHTLITRGSENSRSKDIFDLCVLIPKCNRSSLHQALQKTFEFRGDPLPANLHGALTRIDVGLLKRGWESAVGSMTERVEFDSAYSNLLQLVRDLH